MDNNSKLITLIAGIIVIWMFLLAPAIFFTWYGYMVLSQTGTSAVIKNISGKILTVVYTDDDNKTETKNVQYYGDDVYKIGQQVTIYETPGFIAEGSLSLDKSTGLGLMFLAFGLIPCLMIYYIIKYIVNQYQSV